ncbi:MAG: hypothetical protein RJB50_857, partial [Actinomycetota bacterium]
HEGRKMAPYPVPGPRLGKESLFLQGGPWPEGDIEAHLAAGQHAGFSAVGGGRGDAGTLPLSRLGSGAMPAGSGPPGLCGERPGRFWKTCGSAGLSVDRWSDDDLTGNAFCFFGRAGRVRGGDHRKGKPLT